MNIALQPFGEIDEGVVEHLQRELRRFGDTEVATAAPLPESSFDGSRRQYHASGLLAACRDTPGDRVLGIASVDLYAHGHSFVFGLADIRGRHAVISTARLDGHGRDRLHRRALTEAVHELGHTWGLGHDRNPRCVMHFSKTLEDTDRKGALFCRRCSERIEITPTLART